jgi:hypothetical protein
VPELAFAEEFVGIVEAVGGEADEVTHRYLIYILFLSFLEKGVLLWEFG